MKRVKWVPGWLARKLWSSPNSPPIPKWEWEENDDHNFLPKKSKKRLKKVQMPFLLLLSLLLLSTINNADSQVRVSSDLNCSFESPCLWQNASQSELLGFLVVSDAIPDKRFPVGDGPEENFFAYSFGPPGFVGQAALLSEIVECQLGGAKLKFWHFHSGPRSRLEVCMRFPPGSPLLTSLHCQEPAGNARPQQWQLASVELPPMTRPMELLIRAHFEVPHSLVAVDQITYEAILCENSHRGQAEGAGGNIDGDAAEEAESDGRRNAEQQIHGEGKSGFYGDGEEVDSNPISSSSSNFLSNDQQQQDIARAAAAEDNNAAKEEQEDDLRDYADLATTTRSTRVEEAVSPIERREGKQKKEADQQQKSVFSCDFDQSDFCVFRSEPEPIEGQNSSAIHGWTLASQPIGNPLTGIHKDHLGATAGGGFLYAGALSDSAAVYVLQSRREIPVQQDSKKGLALHFYYQLAGVHGRLRFCFANSTAQLLDQKTSSGTEPLPLSPFSANANANALCPFLREGLAELTELPAEVDPREWRHGVVKVPADSNKLFFVADQLPKNYFIGLDSIRLTVVAG